MTATETNERQQYSTSGLWASIDIGQASDEASFEIETFHYRDLDDDLQATLKFDGFEVVFGLSPDKARELQDMIGAAIAEVEADE